ncbi:MAG: thiol oxidoreductase [Leptospiraceae bacterium]|nr:thiol oxidoreductase [Leptospiraceae bacterium]
MIFYKKRLLLQRAAVALPVAILVLPFLLQCSQLGLTSDPEDNSAALLLAALAGGGSSAALGEEYSGGETTRFDSTVNAFDLPAANIINNISRVIQFQDGNAIFNRGWVQAPAAAFDGLGPVFNRSSCRGCHVRDGRGRPPEGAESDFNSMLFRLSKSGSDPVTGGPLALDSYGTQLQDKAITGVTAEGSVDTPISYTENPDTFPDGEAYSLRSPNYSFNWNFGTPSDLKYSPRVAPAVFGLGLLEAIPESTILSWADPSDNNGDGISGKANYVYDHATGSATLGRFGWKANQPNLNQQNQGAFHGDMGITSSLFSTENCASGQTDCSSSPSGNSGNPFEVSLSNTNLVSIYDHLIAVPGRRDWTDPEVVQGKAKFNEIGCASCHIPEVTTGNLPGFPELSNQVIRPYTDLLLHDMGSGLADNRPDFLANGQEWRTAPLWGVGLVERVNEHTYFLHDGRARSLKEAILWHGGEGTASRDAFKNLDQSDREAIIRFLESL